MPKTGIQYLTRTEFTTTKSFKKRQGLIAPCHYKILITIHVQIGDQQMRWLIDGGIDCLHRSECSIVPRPPHQPVRAIAATYKVLIAVTINVPKSQVRYIGLGYQGNGIAERMIIAMLIPNDACRAECGKDDIKVAVLIKIRDQ